MDALFKPVAAGPGVVVCEPVSAGADAALTDFGAGCSRWMQWCVGLNPALAQTPRVDQLARVATELRVAGLRLEPAQASKLYGIVGATRVVTGRIAGSEPNTRLTYQLYSAPAVKALGAPVTLAGSRADIVRQLPSAARTLLQRAGAKSPRIPAQVGASPDDLALVGRYPWSSPATQPDSVEAAMRELSARLPVASLLAFVRQGRFSRTPDESAARRMLEQSPDNFLTVGEAATIVYNPSSDFRRYMDSLLARFDSATSWPKWMWAWRMAKSHPDRIKALTNVARICPNSAGAWVNLAVAYGNYGESIRNGRLAVAIRPQEFEQLESIYDRWKYCAERAVALDRTHPEGWYRLASASTFAGDPDRADQALWKALSLDPGDTRIYYWGLEMYQPKWGGDHDKLAKVAAMAAKAAFPPNTDIYGLGQELKRAGFPSESKMLIDRAIARARELVRQRPDSAAAHGLLGYYLNDQGMPDQAFPELQAAVRLDPNSDIGHYQLGIYYFLKGNYAESVKHYREDVRIVNGFNARLGLAAALANNGQLDEAETILRGLAAQWPNHWRPRAQLGWVKQHQNKLDAAIAEYKEAERLGPEYYEPHRELCLIYLTAGKPSLAVEEGRMAVRIVPKDFKSSLYFARALAADGDESAAMDESRRAVGLCESCAEARLELGRRLLAAGQKAEARKELQRAVELNGPAEAKKAAQDLLDKNR